MPGPPGLGQAKSARAQRTVPLPDLAFDALLLRREQEEEERELVGAEWQDHGLIFAGPRGDIRDGPAVTRTYQRRLLAAGLPAYRWHALRRVYAAVLQARGVPLTTIRDLLGHSEVRVTEGYAYTMPGALDMAREAINGQLRRRLG